MNQQQQARNLYLQTDMTQADIASLIGISDKTLYRWIKDNNWKQMKQAVRQTPLAIVEMLYKQLYALNNDICTRALPIPTLEEAEVTRKLINSIDKLKKQASLSENIQVLMGFTGYLNKLDNTLAKEVVIHADHYIKEKGYNVFDILPQTEEPVEDITEHVEQTPTQKVPQVAAKKKAKHRAIKKTQVTKSTPQTEQPQSQPAHNPKLPPQPTPQIPDLTAPTQPTPYEQQRLLAQRQAINNFLNDMQRPLINKNKYRW